MIFASGSVKFVCALSSGVRSMGAGSLPRRLRPSASRRAWASSRRRCSSSARARASASSRAFASRILANRSSRRFNSSGSSSPRRLPSAASCSASSRSASWSNCSISASRRSDFLVQGDFAGLSPVSGFQASRAGSPRVIAHPRLPQIRACGVLPHPARHLMSLPARSGALRGHGGGLNVPAMFLVTGS